MAGNIQLEKWREADEKKTEEKEGERKGWQSIHHRRKKAFCQYRQEALSLRESNGKLKKG